MDGCRDAFIADASDKANSLMNLRYDLISELQVQVCGAPGAEEWRTAPNARCAAGLHRLLLQNPDLDAGALRRRPQSGM